MGLTGDTKLKAIVLHRVAIIGAGPVGTALATQLTSIGHSVSISNSRGPETLCQEEQRTGAHAMRVEEGVAQADVVVLGVPVSSVAALKPILQASLRPDAVLVDAGNYYPARDGHIEQLYQGMPDSEWLARNMSKPVIKAFNNIIAANLVISAKPKDCSERSALAVAGDDNQAVAFIMELVEQIGFDAFNAGSLADSWRQQPGQPAYCTEPTLKQLPGLLSRAKREGAAQNRDRARDIVAKLPSGFDAQVLLRVSRLAVGLDMWRPRSYLAALSLGYALLRT